MLRHFIAHWKKTSGSVGAIWWENTFQNVKVLLTSWFVSLYYTEYKPLLLLLMKSREPLASTCQVGLKNNLPISQAESFHDNRITLKWHWLLCNYLGSKEILKTPLEQCLSNLYWHKFFWDSSLRLSLHP